MRTFHVPDDDRGSLPMVMLVITIGMSLSAALVPVVLRQITSTRLLLNRSVAISAAQVGMDMMMARVRAASDSEQYGLLENLPACRMTGDAGVTSAGDTLRYDVSVGYLDQDGKALSCPTNDVPTTATVTSVGTAGTVSRVMIATYVFSTSNSNIPGGAMRIAASSLGNACLDAGTSKPAVGAGVTLQVCNGSSTQQFGYSSDLYLKLVNSESSTATNGMCLTSGSSHSNGVVVVFKKCDTSTTRDTTLQWSLDDASQYRTASASSAVEGYCLTVKTAGQAGSPIVLGSCNNSSTLSIWRADTGVGAGMAGDDTNQLVNYAQFSRCLDVTGQDPGASYMIAWFCKQAPNGVVTWNQQFIHPTPKAPVISLTGNITFIKSNVTYCLKSPQTVAVGTWVTAEKCTNGNKTDYLQWTVYHDTGDYGTSYRIIDSKGYCLEPTDQALRGTYSAGFHSDGTSKVKVVTCSSSELQKWNAPANINKPSPIVDLRDPDCNKPTSGPVPTPDSKFCPS
ncbi:MULTISPECIES: ricin-type beta-trefoil lectin domain protein [Actinoplanes]|uniref:RICIN domain-containing protein n=1 Tax=Actinoplanes TaxID=1865 RepID=UPI0005F2C87D|nr:MULTISPECIES: ricin-type beta-trefoil lectin domain protein [Actinoplanes]GLY05561.1 hypothetical protein Acsp01_59400 [Actinoplanes sp. NBRC 101535]